MFYLQRVVVSDLIPQSKCRSDTFVLSSEKVSLRRFLLLSPDGSGEE